MLACVAILCLPPVASSRESRAIKEAVVPICIVRDDTTQRCRVMQGARSVLDIDCKAGALPQLLTHFTDNVAPLRQILVIEEIPGGNACDGGPKHVLTVARDGMVRQAGSIDWCGGPEPVFSRAGKRIVITNPEHSPTRGEGTIPMQQHYIDEGTLNRRVHLRKSGDGRARTLDADIDTKVQAMRNVAMRTELKGDLVEATSRYLAAWDLLPTPRTIWDSSEIMALDLVSIYAKQRRFREALHWLEQADLSSENMTNAGQVLWYGRIKFEQGDRDEAFRAFDDLYRAWGTRPFVGHPDKYLGFYLDERKKRR